MWLYLIGGILLFLAAYLLIQAIRCNQALKESRKRLAAYEAKTAHLSYGDMTYIDAGKGEAILSVHGIFGGYDQAYETCKDFLPDFRIIAPSRFGYLGSAILGDGSPAQQAKSYVQLLDDLGIEKVFVLAASAGGSAAIRFALDYPQRTKGLILYSSAMPLLEKPKKYMEYAAPPAFLCNDYAMFLISPLFSPIMGMSPSTIYTMLPVKERKAGIVLDGGKTNPDMARNFDAYPIERMHIPTLILHTKDDKLASYEEVTHVLPRFPNAVFVSFEEGGHLLAGHGEEVRKRVLQFLMENSHNSFSLEIN